MEPFGSEAPPEKKKRPSAKRMEMIMTYQPSREVFPSDAMSLQEKMLRLRQQIVEARAYRTQLEKDGNQGEAGPSGRTFGNISSLRIEKQITELRISEMEARLTALLDSYGD